MRKSKLPKTDSIEGLAHFWDTHDLTDFESELKEVTKPVFVRGGASSINVALDAREIQALDRFARAKGVSPGELVRAWVKQNLARRNGARRKSA